MANNLSSPNSPAITIANLGKKFGNFTAVYGLSMQINRGEVFGFLGPNGAGKTTTINMISGLSRATSGQISFHDSPPGGKQDIKTRIGICPQENIFWPKLTCLEQLRFMGEMYNLSRQAAAARGKELLSLMGLDTKSNALAAKLSGGMKRRLNICLALVHDPDILILDEPEAGLDPQSRILVRDFIKSLAKGKTVILTTHNMDEADRLSDRVAIIDHGKLLLLDTPANLKKSIGEGDVLEITLDTHEQHTLDAVTGDLGAICARIYDNGSALILKANDLLQKVPEITRIITDRQLKINKITLRENTLEDVFIHLTGRKLRE
ncbi:MAG TPA: ABC transporter ATP-binding protein [bacterium]|nr:ABC transporter ATP-binding protein [bacterium]HPN46215.1 ABC transporter ATP-binding protein [bacterium]